MTVTQQSAILDYILSWRHEEVTVYSGAESSKFTFAGWRETVLICFATNNFWPNQGKEKKEQSTFTENEKG